MRSQNDRDERKVRALRRVLNVDEPVTLGQRSRVEARIAMERRSEGRPGAAVPAVLGLAGFIGGSALYGLQLHSGALIGVLALGSVLYGLGMRRLMSRTDTADRPVAPSLPLGEE